MTSPDPAVIDRPHPDSVARLIRELAPQVTGALVRRFRDFAAAEDAVQEALVAAALQWPREGLPAHPRGWLIHVAGRRFTDRLRSESARRRREACAAEDSEPHACAPDEAAPAGDDTLLLLFMCCHPALSSASAIALALRAVGGLTTLEIARAFLVPETTMAQRISRAKQTIQRSGVPFQAPTADERQARLAAVLHTLYLIFNEGYASSGGAALLRTDLADEAIHLTRAVHRALPDDGDVAGLLALMLLTDARRAARLGPRGELIPLMEQDRSTWDRTAIAEGLALVPAALTRPSSGPYPIQAAIAALHDEAERPEDTDWPQILALYGVLRQRSGDPMVALSHAVAAAMVHGPATGLELLRALETDERLSQGHRLDAARAHLLERAGDLPAAIERYSRAAARTASVPERDYLLARAARLRERA